MSAGNTDRRWLAVPIVGAFGLLAWAASPVRPEQPAPPTTVANAPAIPSVRAQQTEAIVAANNAEAAKHAKAFTDDGWALVDAAAPDPLLTSASPALIGKREAELRFQLASAPPDKQYLSNVVTIATDAHDAETRVAAVEAIARMGAGDPQFALISILKKLTKSDPARRVLVSLVRPTSTTDALTVAMAALLDDAAIQADEQKALAMSLALVALHEGSALPADVLDSMTSRARSLFEDAQRTAQAKAGT